MSANYKNNGIKNELLSFTKEFGMTRVAKLLKVYFMFFYAI